MKKKLLIISIFLVIIVYPNYINAKENIILLKQIKSLVKNTIVNTLNGKQISMPQNLSDYLKNKRIGVFITFRDINGKVRACYGTVEPMEKNLAWEIIANTKSVLKSDDRFLPLSLLELPHLSCYVSLIKNIEVVKDKYCINPEVQGLRVSKNGKAGVLLPGEAKTVNWMILECLRKAGLSGQKDYTMQRFKTDVFFFNFKEMIYGKK